MHKTLFALNVLLLAFEVFLCGGLFLGYHITFGQGLGDLFFWAGLYGMTLVHLVATWKGRKAPAVFLFALLVCFSLGTVLFSLKATLWRGIEYPWHNGNLFYSFKANDPATVVTE